MIHEQVDQRFGQLLLFDLLWRGIELLEEFGGELRLCVHQTLAVVAKCLESVVELQRFDVGQRLDVLFEIFDLDLDDFIVTTVLCRQSQGFVEITWSEREEGWLEI